MTDSPTPSSNNDETSSHPLKDSFIGFEKKVSRELKHIEHRIEDIEINKKPLFFTGIILFFLSVLIFMGFGSLSAIILILIGSLMIYLSFHDASVVTDLFTTRSESSPQKSDDVSTGDVSEK